MRVAVAGASGFAGFAVVEHLHELGIETVPLVGSTGNSWRLYSRGFTPRLVNVLDSDTLRLALIGCTHVVNCLRGDENVMLKGTRNLTKEALRAGVSRFIHLSSVAVYGDPPAPATAVETAIPSAERGSYGWLKLQQDQIVQAAAVRGLSSIVLCPPNIVGPGSSFLMQVLECLVRGDLLLAEGGACVCNTVDVRNLAQACFLAMSSGSTKGDRYFVTDDERVTWGDLVTRLSAAGQIVTPPRDCTLDELRDLGKEPSGPKASLWRSAKHLVSGDVRSALRKDPLLAKIDIALRTLVASFGPSVEDRLRLVVAGPARSHQPLPDSKANVRLSAQQLRGVWHLCDKAKAELGYKPVYTFAQSLAAFARWLQSTRGMLDADWDARKGLFGYSDASSEPTRDPT